MSDGDNKFGSKLLGPHDKKASEGHYSNTCLNVAKDLVADPSPNNQTTTTSWFIPDPKKWLLDWDIEK